jgi:hypothetical protein
MRALLFSSLVATVCGHGSMIMPPSRNSVDADLPAWSHGKFPKTGTIEPYTCSCNNGTSECSSGQSCFWFSQVRATVLGPASRRPNMQMRQHASVLARRCPARPCGPPASHPPASHPHASHPPARTRILIRAARSGARRATATARASPTSITARRSGPRASSLSIWRAPSTRSTAASTSTRLLAASRTSGNSTRGERPARLRSSIHGTLHQLSCAATPPPRHPAPYPGVVLSAGCLSGVCCCCVATAAWPAAITSKSSTRVRTTPHPMRSRAIWARRS